MFDYQHLKREFDEQGFVIVSKLFDLQRVDRLQKVCQRILSQWRDEYLQTHQKFNKKNCSRLTELQYFYKHPIEFSHIFNTIADECILSILNSICPHPLLFEGAVYFFAPEERSWRGDWHRDGQRYVADNAIEKSRVENSSFIRVHLALINDDNLELIPGSHARWDTPQELEIRKGLNDKLTNSNEMPSVIKINLNPGDAIFFDGYSIHRGNYFADKPRQTLALLYGSPVDWHTPQISFFWQLLYSIRTKILLCP